jgi:hypothetical protein
LAGLSPASLGTPLGEHADHMSNLE